MFKGHIVGKFDDRKSDVTALVIAALVVGFLGLPLYCTLLAKLGLVGVTLSSKTSINSDVVNITSILFSGMILRCRIAFFVVFAFVVVQYSFGIKGAVEGDNMLTDLNIGNSREWLVARSAYAADKLYFAHLQGVLSEWHRKNVQELIDELEQVRETLTFAGTSQPVTAEGNVDRLYITWTNVLKKMVQVGTSSVTDDVSFYETPETQALPSKVIATLWEEGDITSSDQRDVVNATWFIVLLLSCLLVFLMVLELELIFRPVVRQLVDEEKGTKILLKMIPQKVCYFYPKNGGQAVSCWHYFLPKGVQFHSENKTGSRNCAKDCSLSGVRGHR